MISIGNDVVALTRTSIARTTLPAFYKKILSTAEINRYEEEYYRFITLHHYVWLSWSVKEAAYKFLQRHNPQLVFSPTRFVLTSLERPVAPLDKTLVDTLTEQEVTPNAYWKGSIAYLAYHLSFKCVLLPEVLHSIVALTANELKEVHWGIQYSADEDAASQSAGVRNFLLNRLEVLHHPGLTVEKNQHNIPVLKSGVQEVGVPISLSHHGNYLAYAFSNSLK